MKRIVFICAALFASFLLKGCSEETQTVIVASETRGCYGVGLMQCMLIKSVDTDPWQFFYGGIEGFDYEPGYEYVLKVKVEQVENPPQDASSIKYVLVKVVSKEKRDSDSLPPGAVDE